MIGFHIIIKISNKMENNIMYLCEKCGNNESLNNRMFCTECLKCQKCNDINEDIEIDNDVCSKCHIIEETEIETLCNKCNKNKTMIGSIYCCLCLECKICRTFGYDNEINMPCRICTHVTGNKFIKNKVANVKIVDNYQQVNHKKININKNNINSNNKRIQDSHDYNWIPMYDADFGLKKQRLHESETNNSKSIEIINVITSAFDNLNVNNKDEYKVTPPEHNRKINYYINKDTPVPHDNSDWLSNNHVIPFDYSFFDKQSKELIFVSHDSHDKYKNIYTPLYSN